MTANDGHRDEDDLRGFVGWLVLLLLGVLFTLLAFFLLMSVDPDDEPAATTAATTVTTTATTTVTTPVDSDAELLALVRSEVAALYAAGGDPLDSDPNSFVITVEGGVVSADGQVASAEERDRVLGFVEQIPGVLGTDLWLLVLEPDPEAVNGEIKAALLVLYSEYGISGEPELVDGAWFLNGVAPDAAAKSDIAGPARRVEGVTRTRNMLLVSGEPGTPHTSRSTVLTVESGQVALSGVVPTEEARAGVVAAAQAMFGAGNVSDGLVVDADVEGRVVLLGGLAEETAVALDAMATALAGLGFSLDLQAEVVELSDEQRTLQAELDAAVADIVISFASGSDVLSVAEAAKLSPIIEILTGAEDVLVAVEGHTDDRGDAASNQLLSQSRAQAVVDHLVSEGVDAGLLRAAGNGESQPVADNTTAQGRAQNRRTEFRVVV